jgi:hypothetical protein
MIFVTDFDAASSTLRGQHIADALGVKCLQNDFGDEKNGVVVFVKKVDPSIMLNAKKHGNTIVYDPIDRYCKGIRATLFSDYVDILIVPNKVCIRYYSTIFTNAEFVVIPHQWDKRLTSVSPQDQLRTGYIGEELNLVERRYKGERVTKVAEMMDAAPRFNLHLSLNVRDALHINLKPATKIAIAAAVAANVIAFPDPSALDILSADYPFYLHNRADPMDMLHRMEGSFGSAEWLRGLEMMAQVKERTSIEAISALYDFKPQRAA